MAYTQNIYETEYISNKNDAESQAVVDSAKGIAQSVTGIWGTLGETVSGLGQSALGSLVDESSSQAAQATVAGLDALLDPSQYYGQMWDDIDSGEKNVGELAIELVNPFWSGVFNQKDENEKIQEAMKPVTKINDTIEAFDPTGGTSAGRFSGGAEYGKSTTRTNAIRAEGEPLNTASLVGAGLSIYSAFAGSNEDASDQGNVIGDDSIFDQEKANQFMDSTQNKSIDVLDIEKNKNTSSLYNSPTFIS